MLWTVAWAALAVAVLGTQTYALITRFLWLLVHTYYRKISVYGINNFPREGPVILCPNHPNMFVDAIMVITECTRLGRPPYCWAKGAMFANPIAAFLLNKLGAVPVYRPRKAEESLADVDSDMTPEQIETANRRMFERTWEVLNAGNTMILFPEGTSYTAPKMLKLRTGVVRVATGFVKHYDQPIPIVPVGLTYFKKESFRSEVMIEFGAPYYVTPADVASESFKADEKAEVKRITEQLEVKMHQVTLNAREFSTIAAARVMRRLYLNTPSSIDANRDVHLTQQIINLLEQDFGDDDDKKRRVEDVCAKVSAYKDTLDALRVKDQDIVMPVGRESLVQLFFERIVFLLVLLPLGTPGLILNTPFYFLGTKLNKLAGFVESQSMFKIMAAGVLVPVQWLFLILIAWLIGGASYAKALALGLPVFLYSHIRVLEESRSVFENVRFLFNIAAHNDQLETIRKERAVLTKEVDALVTEFVDPQVLALVRKSMDAEIEKHSPKNRKSGPLRYRSLSNGDSLLQ